MTKTWNQPGLWLLIGLLLIGAFAAFFLLRPGNTDVSVPAGGEDAVAAEVPEVEEERPAEEPSATAAAATAVSDEAPAAAAQSTLSLAAPADSDDGILTGDDRSPRLQSLTSGWNTNWERRTISTEDILSGGPPRDGIPSIDNPQFVAIEEAASWLADNEPVIALEIDGDARAYPLQVLTWHEIVNDTVGGLPVVVTFCPLCNSALTFERTLDGRELAFGVSGLLRNSDLIMYDRTTETLWQQFTGEGIIGDLAGEQLAFLASPMVSFADFRAAYPEGEVLSRETGFSRPYGRNPYEGYDTIGSNPFLYRGPIDGRLQAVERVVTVSLADEGVDVAYPLSTLAEMGAINDMQNGRDLAIFHTPGTASALGAGVIAEAEDVGATGVFDPVVDGQKLTFEKAGEAIVDRETGSTWSILGRATDGPLAGMQLEPIVHGNHFWFSWAAFKPDTIVYEP